MIFLCAILPYFTAFASLFFVFFVQCAQSLDYSHKVYFLRMELYRADFVSRSADIFARGLCLPSDIKMTEEEQEVILNIIHHCFD